jgi:hypothetical protein
LTYLGTATAFPFLNFFAGQVTTVPKDFRQRPARFCVSGFFLDVFFDSKPNRTMPRQPRLEDAWRQRIVPVPPSCQEHKKDCSALSIVSKTNSYWKYRIVPAMLRLSVPWLESPDGYRLYFAVYVRPRTWVTPFYLGLIDPFRKWISYPALLKTIRATWDQQLRHGT